MYRTKLGKPSKKLTGNLLDVLFLVVGGYTQGNDIGVN
jgi:hypothetical protein